MKYLLTFTFLLAACTDADMARFGALGDQGHVICYSGGKVIYEGDSTGKIQPEDHSDGWVFKDAKTNKLVRISGDCLIEN